MRRVARFAETAASASVRSVRGVTKEGNLSLQLDEESADLCS